MNYRKGCPDRHEDVAALAMGILPAGETAALHKHLDSCEGCRAFHNTMARQEDYLVSSFDALVQSAQVAADDAATSDTSPPAGREQITARLPAALGRMGRAVAFHPRTAVAAVILAGAIGLFALSWHTGKDPLASPAQAAYSDVLRQIAKARSVRFTKSWQNDGEKAIVMRQTAHEGGWMRTEFASGSVIISNFVTGDSLYFEPRRKVAQHTHIMETERSRLINFVDWIQTLHERDAVYTGRESLDGVPVDVYVADQPYEKFTIWADARTNLPVRVVRRLIACIGKDIRVPYMELTAYEFTMPGEELFVMNGSAIEYIIDGPGVREASTTVTMSDFAWNIDFDQSLFSLTPPDGYNVAQKMEYGNDVEDAQSLVEALRFWVETSSGRFPDNINMLSDAKPLLVRRYRGSDRADEAFQQAIKMMHILASGMYFAQQLKVDDNWHYAGKTVCLGQADKPLAWWLDRKTGLWQVVYGDLHTEALPADQKPADPAPQTQPASATPG